MHIVLVEPEIPQNTGNIARTCALTGTTLNLVKPLGFSVDDKHVKRAGLDYWHLVNMAVYDTLDEVLKKYGGYNIYLATTKTDNLYSDMRYTDNDVFIFGKESKGLPEELLAGYKDSCIKIPMINIGRSLNLSNSVNIILYEAFRQTGFKFL